MPTNTSEKDSRKRAHFFGCIYMYSSSITSDYVLVCETPTLYNKDSVSTFIDQEVKRPSKQWIASIIAGEQERDQVILRTDDFVLLPDTERVNRYWRVTAPLSATSSCEPIFNPTEYGGGASSSTDMDKGVECYSTEMGGDVGVPGCVRGRNGRCRHAGGNGTKNGSRRCSVSPPNTEPSVSRTNKFAPTHVSSRTLGGGGGGRGGSYGLSLSCSAINTPKNPPKFTLNWLSIVHDMRIRTLRDLRGYHVAMLRQMLHDSMTAIEQHTGIPRDQVMAYVHYPPSVYQLHVHFSYPYGQFCHRDAYRVHSLENIINNLEIDSDYYVKATLHLAMYRQSPHFLALYEADTFKKRESI